MVDGVNSLKDTMKKILLLFLVTSLLVNAIFLAYIFYWKSFFRDTPISSLNNWEPSVVQNSSGSIILDTPERYKEMNELFSSVNTDEEFREFRSRNPATIMYFLSLKKSNNESLRNKYAKLLYNSWDIDMEKSVYDEKIQLIFSDSYSDTPLDLDTRYMDLEIILSWTPLISSENLCRESFSWNPERIQSCLDNLYFYRTSWDNVLCEKISDESKVSFCESFYDSL